MKKILAILLALCIVMAFAACGADNNTEETTTAPAVEDTTPEASFGLEETLPSDAELIGGEDEVQVMTYAEYIAAEVDAPVVIEATIQAAQKYNAEYGNTSLYTQSEEGAYFIYRLACTEEEYAELTAGTKIRVNGFKGEWAGEVEIVDATYEIIDSADAYVAEAIDLTEKLGAEDLIDYQNQLAIFKGMTVKEISYKNGEPGDDIYVTFTYGEADYSFCVECDLTNSETEVYKAVGELKAGDVVDVTGFVYWYEGINTHITAIATAA